MCGIAAVSISSHTSLINRQQSQEPFCAAGQHAALTTHLVLPFSSARGRLRPSCLQQQYIKSLPGPHSLYASCTCMVHSLKDRHAFCCTVKAILETRTCR
jgi:hypothetical protein